MNNSSRKIKISIIIPAYNEREHLKRAIPKVKKSIEKITMDYEIIIAEDGSTDGTIDLARNFAQKDYKINHSHSDKRLGRGKALSKAFKKSHGSILIYMDVDLSTDLKHLETLIKSIESGAHFATGSRMLPNSDTKRPLSREIASRIYNFLVRAIFDIPIHDMQCGFKAFERNTLLSILDNIEDNSGFWDTECLLTAHKKGYRIIEFPVVWRHSGVSKYNVLEDGIDGGIKLIRLWWKLRGLRKSK